MKHNLAIGGCVFALFAIATALVYFTLSPVAMLTTAQNKTAGYNWYFKPRDDGLQPTIADDAPFIDSYDVYCLGNPGSSKIYLTFDAGYENGNTEKILNVLKAKNVPAAFFVTKHFVTSAPNLIVRMKDEGHIVGNHTAEHSDLTKLTDPADFSAALDELNAEYKALTGEDMPKYLRPPEGKYSQYVLETAQELGYKTVFWSFAYKDWVDDEQPKHEESIEKICSRMHNGAVILLHSTSDTNAAILGDVIDRLREGGYEFASLDEFEK